MNDYIKSICPLIGIDGELLSAAEKYAAENPSSFTAEKIADFKNSYKKLPPIGQLALALLCLPNVKAEYDKLGIPEEIFIKTFTDIGIWCKRNQINKGEIGLNRFGWIKNHLSMKLFRLGRLQFEIIDIKYLPVVKREVKRNPPIPKGCPVLSVHIAEGEPMGDEACSESFRQAEEFFPRYFTDLDFKGYYCASWLLWSRNREFMPAEGNIVKFMNRFQNIGDIYFPFQTFERLWQPLVKTDFFSNIRLFITGKPKNLKDLPETSSLHKAAKKYLDEGGRMGTGMGVILRK